MSFTPFTVASGTRVWLDANGKIPALLLGSRTMTIEACDSKQGLAELLWGCNQANFILNESALLYQVDDHNITFGAAAIPVDEGSASPSLSPSASASLSPSASPSSSASRSPSASPSAS